jgi:hypothetical protein
MVISVSRLSLLVASSSRLDWLSEYWLLLVTNNVRHLRSGPVGPFESVATFTTPFILPSVFNQQPFTDLDRGFEEQRSTKFKRGHTPKYCDHATNRDARVSDVWRFMHSRIRGHYCTR